MTCSQCENLQQRLHLQKGSYAMTTFDEWKNLVHDNLIDYADYSNGVSEGGSGLMCKTCYTFFNLQHHVAMEENELAIEWLDEVEEWQIKEAATYLYTESCAEKIKRSVEEKDTHTVYTISDLYVPITFYYETNKEKLMFDLEMIHEYGINHEEFSMYSSLFLSLEDCIRNLGNNDEYVKNSFVLSFDISKEDLNIYPLSNPYGEPKVRISTNKYISPENIRLIDGQNDLKQVLTFALLDRCKNRDNDDYLAMIREKQKNLPDIECNGQKEEKITELIKIIESNRK